MHVSSLVSFRNNNIWNDHVSYKERSISPADVRHGRFKGALGDCFQTGLRPSQESLNPTASGSAVATPTIRHV